MNSLNLLNILILLSTIICALVVLKLKDTLQCIIAMAVMGSFIAVEFLMLKAPDVALAEAAVGAILTPVIFIVALKKVEGKGERRK